MRPPIVCPSCGHVIEPRPYRKQNMSDDEMKIWLENETDHVLGPHQTPCWIWRKVLSSRGYGSIMWKGKRWATHRLAYVLWKGPIPKGKVVRHLLDCAKACCNPQHLEIGTQKQNIREHWARRINF